MKAFYRNFSKNESYISVVAAEYFIHYEPFGFSIEQIKAPIKNIVELLEYEINQCASEQQFDICVYKKCSLIFDEACCVNTKYFSQSFLTILSYFRGEEPWIKYTMQRTEGVLFPEKNKEKYLEFVSAMTKTAVIEILQSTRTHLLNTKKRERDESPLQRSTIFQKTNSTETSIPSIDASTSNL